MLTSLSSASLAFANRSTTQSSALSTLARLKTQLAAKPVAAGAAATVASPLKALPTRLSATPHISTGVAQNGQKEVLAGNNGTRNKPGVDKNSNPYANEYNSFMTAFKAGHISADYDRTGSVDTNDFDAFMQDYTRDTNNFNTFVKNFQEGNTAADVDGSGSVDTNDFDFFVKVQEFARGDFRKGSMAADIDGNKQVDLDDYTSYVNALKAGTSFKDDFAAGNADIDGSGFTDTDDFDTFTRAMEYASKHNGTRGGMQAASATGAYMKMAQLIK